MSGRSQLVKFLAWGVSITILVVGTSVIVYKKKTRRLPPLTKQYIIGTLMEAMAGRLPQLLLENSREVGPVFRMAFLTWNPVIVVSDPVLARQLLETDSNKSRGYRRFRELTFNHPNIVSKDTFNDGWEWARKAVSPSFSNTNLFKTLPKLHQRLNELIQEFDKYCQTEEKFDMNDVMMKFTFNFIATSMFGVDYKLDLSADSHSEASMFLHEIHIDITEAFKSKTLRIDQFWNGEPARAALASKRLRQLTQGILDHYRSTHSAEEIAADTSILSHLVRSPYETDEGRCADMLIFLIAGHDTTSFTIAWTLIELSRNPQVVYSLRQELDRVNHNPEQEFTVSQLGEMDYLLAVLKESMRLNPVAATGPGRRYDHDITVGDYVIPKDCSLLFPFYVIFRTGIQVYNAFLKYFLRGLNIDCWAII
jgi:cytochrome P450/NADPH-cytochrome P450 reductase